MSSSSSTACRSPVSALVIDACAQVYGHWEQAGKFLDGQRAEASNLLHVMQATNIIFYAVTSNLL